MLFISILVAPNAMPYKCISFLRKARTRTHKSHGNQRFFSLYSIYFELCLTITCGTLSHSRLQVCDDNRSKWQLQSTNIWERHRETARLCVHRWVLKPVKRKKTSANFFYLHAYICNCCQWKVWIVNYKYSGAIVYVHNTM